MNSQSQDKLWKKLVVNLEKNHQQKEPHDGFVHHSDDNSIHSNSEHNSILAINVVDQVVNYGQYQIIYTVLYFSSDSKIEILFKKIYQEIHCS